MRHRLSRALASAGCSRAYSSSGMPAIAASQASRRPDTPAAGPSGWAMMPPPAVTIRSARSEPGIGARRLPGRLAGGEDRHRNAGLVLEHRREAGPGRGDHALVRLRELALQAVDMHVVGAGQPPELLPGDIGPAEHRVRGTDSPSRCGGRGSAAA